MYPNFIVIGVAKCGTTSICDLLSQHPDVYMSSPKEPHFFGRDTMDERRAWYESLFEDVSNESAVGEGSTSYTHPDIIEQSALDIKSHIPDCRIILMVRNPLKRLESDWKMRRFEGWTKKSINDAVLTQKSLVQHGLYWQHLSVYRKYFSDEQILVVFLEEFSKDPVKVLEICFQHIKVDEKVSITDCDKPRNESSRYRVDSALAKYLRKLRMFEVSKSFIPRPVFKAAKSILTKKPVYTPDWDPRVKESVIDVLKSDSQSLLAYCNKPPDYWELK